MFKFKEFVFEADSEKTKVDEIKLELSKDFDAIKEAKKLKKQGDVNSEIASVNKQAEIYSRISNNLKALATEMKSNPAGKESKTTIY
jgi:hypothetical protein